MNQTDNTGKQGQQGSGSSENKGQERSEQKTPGTDLSSNEVNNIASQIGEPANRVADLKSTGGLSGRDDSSGGSGDRMEQEYTNKPTDR